MATSTDTNFLSGKPVDSLLIQLQPILLQHETPTTFSLDRDDKCTISYQLFNVVREVKDIVDGVRSAVELTDTVSSNALESRFIQILKSYS